MFISIDSHSEAILYYIIAFALYVTVALQRHF